MSTLFKDRNLINKNKESVSADTLAGKTVAIYFSAHWCPPCRGFTPVLASFYNRAKAAGVPFEVVFVSSDRSLDDQISYMKESHGDWLAVPMDDPFSSELKQRYGICGIPTLLVITPDGVVIDSQARSTVSNAESSNADIAGVFENWKE